MQFSVNQSGSPRGANNSFKPSPLRGLVILQRSRSGPAVSGVRPMKASLILILGAASLVACAERTVDSSTECFGAQLVPRDLSQAELNALNHSKLLTKERCNGRTTHCGFSLNHWRDGEIAIMVMFASTASTNCVRLPGNFQVDIYDSAGRYVRTDPGA